jgi:hypothetical protein
MEIPFELSILWKNSWPHLMDKTVLQTVEENLASDSKLDINSGSAACCM